MLILAILILITSLAIAGIAAYFSIVGLALLFVGSGQSIIVMGTALEVGKLVVVSFLHQYWERLNFLIKTYLIIATVLLMAITSIGIYGYLSSGYNTTSNKVKEIERQISSNEKQIAQYRSDILKFSNFEYKSDNDLIVTNKDKFVTQQVELIKQKEERINASRITAEQEKKKIIEEQNNAKVLLDGEINKEIEQIKLYNDRLVILDKEVQTWLDQGTGGLFKANGIEKARQVKQLQEKERNQIDEQIKNKQVNIEKLRAEYNSRILDLSKTSEKITNTLSDTIKQIELDITKSKQAIEEYQLKTDKLLAEQVTIKDIKQREVAAKIKQDEAEIEKLLSSNNALQGQILNTDIGTFKFVAKSLNTELDQAVNWFIWIIMMVFDPLAVSLVICFNYILKQRKPKETTPEATKATVITNTPTLTPTPAYTFVSIPEIISTTMPMTSTEVISGIKKVKQPPPKEGEVARLEKILEEQRKERAERKHEN